MPLARGKLARELRLIRLPPCGRSNWNRPTLDALTRFPDWQRVLLDRLTAYADEWEAQHRREHAAMREGSSAGDLLAGIVIAGGLIGLAAVLFAAAASESKSHSRQRKSARKA